MNTIKNIAVYCGASEGKIPEFKQQTIATGTWLAKQNIELVYGGGGVGLMGVLAKAVLESGGTVHGIIPQELFKRETAYKGLTQLEIVDNMSIRKARMIELADGCITLPGGPGTLEEASEAFSWALIGDNPTPVTFLNVNHYYDPLITMFDEMTANGFLSVNNREKLFFSDSLDEIYNFMVNYSTPEVRTYSHD